MSDFLEVFKWVLLGILMGGSVGYVLGYVRAAEEGEAALYLLQLEQESIVRLMQKGEDL